MRSFFFFGSCLLLVTIGWGDTTYTWIGGTSGVWSNPDNWTPSEVPNSPTAVVEISSAASSITITVDGTFEIAEIDFSGSSFVTLTPLSASTGLLQLGSPTTINSTLSFSGTGSYTLNVPLTIIGATLPFSSYASVPATTFLMNVDPSSPVSISTIAVSASTSSTTPAYANLNVSANTSSAQVLVLNDSITLNTTGTNYNNFYLAQVNITGGAIGNITASIAAASSVTLNSATPYGGPFYIPTGSTLALTNPGNNAFSYIHTEINGPGSLVISGAFNSLVPSLDYTGPTYLTAPGAATTKLLLPSANQLPSLSAVIMQPESAAISMVIQAGSGTIAGLFSPVSTLAAVVAQNTTLAIGSTTTSTISSYGGLLAYTPSQSSSTLPFNIIVDGGELILTMPSASSFNPSQFYYPYNGSTSLVTGTLTGGAANALSGLSPITMSGTAALSLHTSTTQSFSQQIAGLSSSSTLATVDLGSVATSGTLTIVPVTLTAVGAGFNITQASVTAGTFAGEITGSGGLTLGGSYTLGGTTTGAPYALTLTGTSNSYSGLTTVSSLSQLIAGAANSLSPNSVISLFSNATLALNGNAQVIAGLSGSGVITAASASLTLSNTVPTVFSGSITGLAGLEFTGTQAATLSTLALIGSASTLSTPTVAVTLSTSGASPVISSVTVPAGNMANLDLVSGSGTPQTITLSSGIINLNTTGTNYSNSSVAALSVGTNVTASLAGASAVTLSSCNLAGSGTLYISASSTLALTNPNNADQSGNVNYVNATIAGPGSVVVSGSFYSLSSALDYTGPTYLIASDTLGTALQSSLDNTLPSQSVIVMQPGGGNVFLSIPNVNTTIAGLSSLTNTSSAIIGVGSTLSIGSPSASTIASYGGLIIYHASTLVASTLPFNIVLAEGQLTLTQPSASSFEPTQAYYPYNGVTTITGGTLIGGANNAFSGLSPIVMSDAAALSLSTSATQSFSQQIAGLSGSSTLSSVNLGSGATNGVLTIAAASLVANATLYSIVEAAITAGTFAGEISGSGGLTLGGSYTLGSSVATVPYALTLTGTSNSYSGLTTIAFGSQLIAGTTNSFSPSSAVTIASGATLNLNNFANTIQTLEGAGNVVTGASSGCTLTISNGDNQTYSGVMSGQGGLVLSGGSLSLSGSNTYGGLTTVASGAILTAAATGALPSGSAIIVNSNGELITGVQDALSNSSALTVNGTLDLEGNSQTIFVALQGSGVVTTPTAATLTFSGPINVTCSCDLENALSLSLVNNFSLGLYNSSNTYTGLTTIDAGSTLTAGTAGALSPNSAVTIASGGTLHLSIYPNTIQTLEGSGAVTTGGTTAILTLHNGGDATFSGAISGSGGLTVATGAFTLSGTSNSYSGLTTLDSGAQLNAGTINTLSTLSAALLASNATLNLNGLSQQIAGLSGSGGAIAMGAGTLSIASTTTGASGSFAGQVTGAGGLTLGVGGNSYALTLTGASNSYSGQTTVNGGSQLIAQAAQSLSPNSPVDLAATNATLSLKGYSETIAALFGSGSVDTGSGSGILTLSSATATTFSGSMIGTGGLTLAGGYGLTLSGLANSYSGPTTISSTSALAANATQALSPSSAITLNGTLSMNGFTEQIAGLSGSGTLITGGTNAILTVSAVSGGSGNFSGRITGAGGLAVGASGESYSLTLSGSSNNYTGPTSVFSGSTLTATAIGAFSSGSTLTVNGALLAEATDVLTSLPPVTINGLLDLSGYDETITNQILGAGIVTSSSPATLTFSGITSSTCSCQLTGAIALTLASDYSLSLTPGSSNSNTGPTTIDGGSLLTVGGNIILSPLSSMTINSGGTLSLGGSNTVSDLSGGGAIAIAAGKTLTFGDGNSTTFSGSITGGALYQQGTGTFTFTGTGDLSGGATVSSGRWNMDSVNWTGPMTILPSGTLGGTGTLSSSVVLQGTIAPGHSSGTLSFNPGSTVIFSPGSTYFVSIDSAGSSALVLGADTTLAGTLSVTVAPGTVLQDYYTIVKMMDASYTGEFSSVVFSNDYPFTVKYLPRSVVLTTIHPTSLASLTGNRAILANYLVQFLLPKFQLNFLPIGALEQALDRISPARNFASAFALQNSAVGLSKQLSWRLADRRHLFVQEKAPPAIASLVASAQAGVFDEVVQMAPLSAESAGFADIAELAASDKSDTTVDPDSFPNYGEWWISGMGQFGHLAATAQGQNPSFDFNAGAALLGCDYGKEVGLAGFAAGYLKDVSMMAGDFGSASSDSLIVMFYGTYNPSPFWIELSFLEATSWFNNERNISFPGFIPAVPNFSATATSEHTGWTIDPHIDLGYAFNFTWGSISPYVAFDAAIVVEESYNETGAAPYNFSIASRTSELFRTEVGLSFRQNLFWKELSVMFKEMLSYVNQTPSGDQMNTALFSGGLSVAPGVPAIALTTATGTENLFSPVFELFLQWRDFSFSTSYAGQFGSNFHSNEVFGSLGYRF
ncbi:MAG: hypothetical protein KGI80_03190 [Verrucomicrobiota bacterium]|nr:hypothetical protein [Verrucomicrobiota bacterium]